MTSENKNQKTLLQFLTFVLIVVGLFNLLKGFVFSTDKDDNPIAPKNYKESFQEDYGIYAPPIPDNMEFAGEEVPMDNFDVREGFDRELLVNTYWQSHTMLFFKMAARFFPMIEPVLAEHGIPEDFKYIAVVESDLRQATSPAGAKGMWQFMRGTAKDYGLEINEQIDERYHVEKATAAACKYFKESKEEFGTWTLAAASYNRGRQGIQRQMDRQKQDGFYDLLLTTETQRYIYRVLAVKYIMQHPEKYGFHFRKKDLYLKIPTYTVKIDSSVSHFADFAKKHDINYKILKYFNPWLRETSLNNPRNKTYEIKIPEEGMRSWEKIKARNSQEIKNPKKQF